MIIDNQTGLVLEGGGMRATFTVGVLDCFMDHNIWFPYTIGVSAGASNGISYASRQRGRSRFGNIDLLKSIIISVSAISCAARDISIWNIYSMFILINTIRWITILILNRKNVS